MHQLLTFIEKKLNTHLKLKFGISEDKLVLTTLSTSGSGEPSAMLNDSLVMTLMNIEEEKTHNTGHKYVRTKVGFSKMNPPIQLNIYLLFAAYFNHENYAEGIKLISAVLGFFQVNNMFQSTDYPALAGVADKVSVELVSMDVNRLNQIWGSLAANYRPSALYRFRSIIVQESVLKDDVSLIQSI